MISQKKKKRKKWNWKERFTLFTYNSTSHWRKKQITIITNTNKNSLTYRHPQPKTSTQPQKNQLKMPPKNTRKQPENQINKQHRQPRFMQMVLPFCINLVSAHWIIKYVLSRPRWSTFYSGSKRIENRFSVARQSFLILVAQWQKGLELHHKGNGIIYGRVLKGWIDKINENK